MENAKIDDATCWKLAIKFLLINRDITEEEYKNLHDFNVLMKNRVEVDKSISIRVDDILEIYPQVLIKLIQTETAFLIDRKIPDNFEMYWVSYLIECLTGGYINEDTYQIYRNSINFDTPITKKEYYLIDEVLEYLRTKTVKKAPSVINFIDNPSFDVLMAANELTC